MVVGDVADMVAGAVQIWVVLVVERYPWRSAWGDMVVGGMVDMAVGIDPARTWIELGVEAGVDRYP